MCSQPNVHACAFCKERRKRARLMKTASRLTQAELLEVMSVQVRRDEQKRSAGAAAEEEEEEVASEPAA